MDFLKDEEAAGEGISARDVNGHRSVFSLFVEWNPFDREFLTQQVAIWFLMGCAGGALGLGNHLKWLESKFPRQWPWFAIPAVKFAGQPPYLLIAESIGILAVAHVAVTSRSSSIRLMALSALLLAGLVLASGTLVMAWRSAGF
ncbi:MAG: hypothetical protein IT452_01125 [Planctomycetia bacterium]|nr:hypothetical protein [Planctomycetia bacterium]